MISGNNKFMIAIKCGLMHLPHIVANSCMCSLEKKSSQQKQWECKHKWLVENKLKKYPLVYRGQESTPALYSPRVNQYEVNQNQQQLCKQVRFGSSSTRCTSLTC